MQILVGQCWVGSQKNDYSLDGLPDCGNILFDNGGSLRIELKTGKLAASYPIMPLRRLTFLIKKSHQISSLEQPKTVSIPGTQCNLKSTLIIDDVMPHLHQLGSTVAK